MNIKKEISENVMILEFLKAELDSSRFKDKIDEALKEYQTDLEIITNANLDDIEENEIRKKLFNSYREYENSESLFEGFPKNVEWFDAEISKEELLNKVYYINYDYWIELSNGSRLPKDAAKTIKEGKIIFEVSNENFINASNDYKKGKKFSKLILVTDGKKIVVLEGHLRITVYALNPEIIPEYIPIIIGSSEDMANWSCF